MISTDCGRITLRSAKIFIIYTVLVILLSKEQNEVTRVVVLDTQPFIQEADIGHQPKISYSIGPINIAKFEIKPSIGSRDNCDDV